MRKRFIKNLLWNLCIYLFEDRERGIEEWEQWVDTERCVSWFTLHSWGWGWTRPKPKGGNSILISYLGNRDPATWAIRCLLPPRGLLYGYPGSPSNRSVCFVSRPAWKYLSCLLEGSLLWLRRQGWNMYNRIIWSVAILTLRRKKRAPWVSSKRRCHSVFSVWLGVDNWIFLESCPWFTRRRLHLFGSLGSLLLLKSGKEKGIIG